MDIWIDTDIDILDKNRRQYTCQRMLTQIIAIFLKEDGLLLCDKVGCTYIIDGKKYDIQKIYAAISDGVYVEDTIVELSKDEYQI